MSNGPQIRVKFFGVRGSIPVPAQEFLHCGGNTSCVELRIDGTTLVIDAGTGIRRLGTELQSELGQKASIHLLLTHFHWDHIQGLPFFAPLYSTETELTFYSARPAGKLQELLEGGMSYPYFPVDFGVPPAKREFIDLTAVPFSSPDVRITPFPLNHPQEATGYRIEANGKTVTHASDFEHGNAGMDGVLREHAANSDILIYDAQFTPAEYLSRKGWGHSTWLEATRVAQECNVKQLILFHHDPSHDDETMRDILHQARAHFENTALAREGMEIIL